MANDDSAVAIARFLSTMPQVPFVRNWLAIDRSPCFEQREILSLRFGPTYKIAKKNTMLVQN